MMLKKNWTSLSYTRMSKKRIELLQLVTLTAAMLLHGAS